jgi:hypothetical protein
VSVASPVKGDRFVRLHSTRRVDGEDRPVIYRVTSVGRDGGVYLAPDFETPVRPRPIRYEHAGIKSSVNDYWLSKPMVELFVDAEGWVELDPSDGWLAHTVDETECVECSNVIGPVLAEDPETGHDRSGWVTAFHHPDGEGALLCEDCLVWIEEETNR